MVLGTVLAFVAGTVVGWYVRKFYRDKVNAVVEDVKEAVTKTPTPGA